jgi:hypothetical protein
LHIVPNTQKQNPEQQRLLALFAEIAPDERATLMAFAEFLAGRRESAAVLSEMAPCEPKVIERPAEESVVKAIKRLSTSYFMLERGKLLDETSSLMMSHIMQGRGAKEVIDELEILFTKHYQEYLKNY